MMKNTDEYSLNVIAKNILLSQIFMGDSFLTYFYNISTWGYSFLEIGKLIQFASGSVKNGNKH